MPEISVLIYTARDDYPYVGKAEGWHCFEPFLRTLADQTFRDFELVLVDALWETRPEWFRDRPQPFAVKHVPASPNYWHARGRTGLAAQINRGFVWADGRFVWMGGENNLYPPHHLALAADLFRTGKLPVAWYGIADRTGDSLRDRPEYSLRDPSQQASSETSEPCPDIVFDLQGFTRADVFSMDHRAARFVSDPSLVLSLCSNQHYYGYSGVPIDAAVAVNGFDELMDGRMSLQDCDFGGRLGRHGCEMVMHRDLFVVEPPCKPLAPPPAGAERGELGGYAGGLIRCPPVFQCNHAIWGYNALTGRRVNTRLPDGFVEDVRRRMCLDACSLKDICRTGQHGEPYPFCGGEREPVALQWHRDAPVRELSTERELRKLGTPPYDRGLIRGV